MPIAALQRRKIPTAVKHSRGGEAIRRACDHEAKILIVDEEKDLANLLVLILQRAGYRNLQSTPDAAAALHLVHRFRPHVIVLHSSMSGLGESSVLAQLRAAPSPGAALPILVVSGDPASATRLEALRGGASDFLAKPYQINELLSRIEALLAARFPAKLDAQLAARALPSAAIPHFARKQGHSVRSVGRAE